MSKYVVFPGLPEKKIECVICGSCGEKALSFLKSYVGRVFVFENNPFLDSRVAFHTDLNIFHKGGNEIILAPYLDSFGKALEKEGLSVSFSHKKVESPYPSDCLLNAAAFPGYIFMSQKIADKEIISFARENSSEILDVSQGYTKCSVLIVNEKAFITDDEGIYKKGIENGFRCILVEKGDVGLQGFDYGFIGGCAGLVDKNLLLFFGDISRHRSFEKISRFLSTENCRFIYDKSFPLSDIGGIIPLSYI